MVNPLKGLREVRGFYSRDRPILRQARRERDVIYGGQALVAQLGGLARGTRDYDIKSRNPTKSAFRLQRTLDRRAGGDYYYASKSKFTPGVRKVLFIGDDLKRNTSDDIGLADFSPLKRSDKFVTIKGQRYATLASRERDAHRALSQKQYAFRAERDKSDLARIQAYRNLKKKFL